MLPASVFSAYQMAFGSNPMNFLGWEAGEGDLLFAQDTPLTGQFAQQRKWRMRAQGATLQEVANSKLRRLLAHNKTFNWAEIDNKTFNWASVI